MAGMPMRRQRRVAKSGQAAEASSRVWAPFEDGNDAAVKHGAYSPKVRQPRAEELVNWILAQDALRHVHDQSFRPALWRWAQRQAMADLLFVALTRHHAEAPCAGCEQCRSWEVRWQIFDRTAERAGQSIGLDPQSRADLLLKMAGAGLVDRAENARSVLGTLMKQMQAFEDALGDEDGDPDGAL